MRRLNWVPILIALSIRPMAAAAEAITVPVDLSQAIDKPIQQIVAHYGLNQQEASLARKAAAEFTYIGLCRGVGSSSAAGATSLIMRADPDVPYQAAALAIVGVYTRSAFGRQNSTVCEKAHDDATKQ